MTEGERLYDEVCAAGDTGASVRGLTDMELRTLHGYTAAMQSHLTGKGGIPAVIKWVCCLEASARFFNNSRQP